MSLCGYEGFIINNGLQTGLLRCLSLEASSRNLRMAIGLKPKQWALMTQMLWLNIVNDFLTTGWEVIVRSWGSVQFSHSVVSDSLQPHEPQHARPPCPSPTPEVHPNPCPLCQWCHPTISSSVIPFSSCPQSFPASGSLQMSQLSASGDQSIGVSASTAVLPMNTQDWSPLEWTDLLAVQGTLESSPTPQFKSINSSALSFLYSPTLTSIHDYWKNHSLD